MITHEEVQDATILHKITVVPKFAPQIELYVVQTNHSKSFYVVRDPKDFFPARRSRYYTVRSREAELNFFSRHSREDLALRAALRRARRYEAAYAVDRSRGRFAERR